MIALLFIIVLLLIAPFFFPGYYITELMVSFLPYLVAITLFFLVLSFVHFKKKMKPGYIHTRYRYFRGISFLVFCILFFLWSKQFNRFYISEPLVQDQGSGLTILYANIHKDNMSYEALQSLITEKNPDVLMFVEFADHHYDNLQTFLTTNYPYTNNTTRSKTFIGSMVFSKYPINNKADDFPQGAWRYGYFSIPYQGQDVYFYLVHTSSPDSYDHFLMRNNQLETFVTDFHKHESERMHKNIVVAGDFNITPWSPYYTILSEVFSGTMDNATRYLPFLFTRRLKEFPLFFAHIDHLWTTSSFALQHLEALKIPGSDHKGFLFTLQRKE